MESPLLKLNIECKNVELKSERDTDTTRVTNISTSFYQDENVKTNQICLIWVIVREHVRGEALMFVKCQLHNC